MMSYALLTGELQSMFTYGAPLISTARAQVRRRALQGVTALMGLAEREKRHFPV